MVVGAMPPTIVIPPPASTTPAGLFGVGRRAIPADLIRDASRRLRVLSLVAAALWVIGPLTGHVARLLMAPDHAGWSDFTAADGIAALAAFASLGLAGYARRREDNPGLLLDLGLAYMVFTAVALGLMMHFGPIPEHYTIVPAISWNGVMVLMAAAIVPSTPAKTLVAALIAVSMNPLSMLVARAMGRWDFGPASLALLMHYPDYLLVGVAVVISHVVTRLGQQVAKARELGSYQLGELIGRGGMGEVYKATHRMLARPAAIKLIRAEMLAAHDRATADLAMTRFRREAEAAAHLRSPHTVELYDFGVTEDRTLYFVMELLEGMTLESLVRPHGPMPAGRVI
jgi:serine/threonine-protein kinase